MMGITYRIISHSSKASRIVRQTFAMLDISIRPVRYPNRVFDEQFETETPAEQLLRSQGLRVWGSRDNLHVEVR